MNPDPEKWGVEQQYRDVHKQIHVAPADTVDGILRGMGAETEGPDHGVSTPLVFASGEHVDVEGDWEATLEDGTRISGSRLFPHDLPFGYHRLRTAMGERRLIVAPRACRSFAGIRKWGWAAQLYALRSRKSWGIGDLGDLHDFGAMVKLGGADFVLLNPLHAAIPGVPQQSSPYYPSSREFRNPLYIDVARIPGVEFLEDIETLAAAGHRLNDDSRIDRDAVWRLKITALEALWQRFPSDDSAFAHYREQHGFGLHRYATYCALREEHGMVWTHWPDVLRHPSSGAVKQFAIQHADRVLFHQWLQWLLDVQLKQAGSQLELINDLAIGVDPAGADAWLWQDAFALNMRVGAPPDRFNQRGQDWGLPPFDPWRLQHLDYEPFIHTIRAGLEHVHGIRIDHVMGLFRLFWIPEGASAPQGTYVRYPWKDLLSILCLESVRADAYVIGEDLGTVEPYMRDELSARNIASYRLLWFEENPPPAYPQKSMAAITTHDLPTVSGLWSGSDLVKQHDLGMQPNVEATEVIRARLAQSIHLADDAPVPVAADACHALLATASSALVSATLEDALRLAERPNYPGTTDEWPNWSVALPVLLEDLPGDQGFLATQQTMSSARHEMPYHDSYDPG